MKSKGLRVLIAFICVLFIAGWYSNLASTSAPPATWEYVSESQPTTALPGSAGENAFLNQKGAQGWELLQIQLEQVNGSARRIYYFKKAR